MNQSTSFIFILGMALLTGCSSTKEKKTIAPVDVKVMTVSSADDELNASYVGTVEESYGSQLSFATMGTVSQVYVDEGSPVRQGQVLATLDATAFQNAYDIALSTLNQARDAYQRLDLLHRKGSLAEIKYVDIQTKLSQAVASERIARKNLNDCVLRAPFDGYISQRSVDIGNNVAPTLSCFKLVKIGAVKVKVSIPEKEIAGIHIGQTVSFTVAALDGRSFLAKVKEKGVQANALSHTYEIKIELPNSDHALLPGMVCSVSVSNQDATDAIIIPQQAVMIDGQGTYVWVADGNISRRRTITTGDVNNSGIVIVSGLHPGEQVIVCGQNKVSEGSKITVR